ncbi:MAG: transposase [Betaproteobacteria bacterium]|nr:transposase [Betaproteobacteria bacterium]
MSCPFPGLPAGVAVHLIQRAHARAACFFRARDRAAYLLWLRVYAGRYECSVHAYVLMGNHVHLLLTPSRGGSAEGLMHALRARHARYAQDTYRHAGALWEEGFEASPVHARRYLLACMRYIELNPVRAHLVERPGDYPWSSFRANGLGQADALVTPHPLYCALARTPDARQAAYRALCQRAPCMLGARH